MRCTCPWIVTITIILAAGCNNTENRTLPSDTTEKHRTPPKTKDEQVSPPEAIDVPSDVDIGYVSGMRAVIDKENYFKILYYGETEAHGGIRLSPLSFGAIDHDGKKIVDGDTVVILDRAPKHLTLNCYRGQIKCDRDKKRVSIALEVNDRGQWKPFGWNGDWPLELIR